MIMVSACLAGINCRYDGGNKLNKKIKHLMEAGEALPVCPELLSGLSIPRQPAEIVGGSGMDVLSGTAEVVTKNGQNVTALYLAGAQRTLEIINLIGASSAILANKSPACGFRQIYDGSFTNKRRAGMGVTAVLLQQNGIKIEPANGAI